MSKDTASKRLFSLPAAPVDGYVIQWYEYQVSDYNYSIYFCQGRYYLNTPWEVYSPGSGRDGAPLVDDWMMSRQVLLPEKGYLSAEGRWSGWKSPEEEREWKDCYLTQAEAMAAAKEKLRQRLDISQKQVQRLEKLLRELEASCVTGG